MSSEAFQTQVRLWLADFLAWVSSSGFYSQFGIAILAILIGYSIAAILINKSVVLQAAARAGEASVLRTSLLHVSNFLKPLLIVITLGFAADFSQALLGQSGLVRTCLGVAVLLLIQSTISQFVAHRLLRILIRWTVIPIAVLHVFGWLDEVVLYLDGISIDIGNIEISLYSIFRVVIFGSLLFWLGRFSNTAGQQVIRKQEDLDLSTRELFAKLYEVIMYVVVFLLLLQVMGVNLTTLAVFGGALGVGLGFGLQAIASNFISGIILLLDRSLTVDDHIELEDGRTGIIKSMNMRCTTLETYDGKIVVVPNETFITTSFTNWTHNNAKQRYSIEFQVSYKTDLHRLFDLLREVVASHPQVISGEDVVFEERPDAEIAGFGESGVDILVEFWMHGIDDGKNRVGGDLLLMIWDAFKENDIEIPFPQRDVRLVADKAEMKPLDR